MVDLTGKNGGFGDFKNGGSNQHQWLVNRAEIYK